MPEKTVSIAKDIFSADTLVDLGVCLADYIWFNSWEGKDTTDLEEALDSIKAAAATELAEDETFPDSVSMAVENACKALNITKVEELDQMVNSKPAGTIQKEGQAVVDSDPRDSNGNTVSQVTASAPIIPAGQKVPKKVYGKDGKSTTSKVNVVNGEERDGEGNVVTQPDAASNQDTSTVNTEDAPTDDTTNTSDIIETDNPDGSQTTVENAASDGDLKKSIENGDLAKIVSEAVGAAIAPLKEEIDRLKSSPAPSKRAGSFMDVEKAEPGVSETAFAKNKARFDELMTKADDFAANPQKGSVQDRVKIGVELRKLSRLMDPASVAQHAAIRASLPLSSGQ